MAGVEIDIDSDEYQGWYTSFSKFPLQAIFEAQHKISEILTKYFEESSTGPNVRSRVIIMQLSDGGRLRSHL